jgi:hypothetical protein
VDAGTSPGRPSPQALTKQLALLVLRTLALMMAQLQKSQRGGGAMSGRVIDLDARRAARGNPANEIPASTYLNAQVAVRAGTATPQQREIARVGDQLLAPTIARFRRAMTRRGFRPPDHAERNACQQMVVSARPRERSGTRPVRTRGSRRSVASTASSSRGDPEPGCDEPGPGSGQPLLLLVDEGWGRVNLPMLRTLRAAVA